MPFKENDPNINREGRPKGSVSVVDRIKQKLQECPEGIDKKTYRDILVDEIFSKAIDEKDVAMMRDIIDRVDGKPKQGIDHTTGGDKISLTISEVIANKNNL